MEPRVRYLARRALLSTTFCAVLISLAHAARAERPAIVLLVDRDQFELSAHDLRDASAGPRFPVVLGSPHHPTPKGSFWIYHVVREPGWTPGPDARARGAERVPPSARGPMGVAKIPFAQGGFALHGGAEPLLLGKPVSLGCIRARDEDLLALLSWLEARDALTAPESAAPTGESLQKLRTRVQIQIQ